MSTSEILRPDRQRKQDRGTERDRKRVHRSQRIAEARQRARAAVGAAGIPRVLRLPEVEVVTGKPRSGIYEEVENGTFPAPIPLSERAVGWLESEVIAWLEQRIAERDKKHEAEAEKETARVTAP
jgi:prophage regulatory protein